MHYVIFIKQYSVVNRELYQGYEELVTIFPGCVLMVSERGLIRKTSMVEIPYTMADGTYSDITKRETFRSLVDKGLIENKLYTEKEIIARGQGLSTHKWSTRQGGMGEF